MYLMKIDEALYQIKQRIKMHELRDTTNSANEREKAILDYITNLQQRIDKAINYILENICCDTRVYTKSQNVYKVIDILRGDDNE